MKKSIIIVSTALIISLIVAIIGVSQIDILKNSNITEDADYQSYLELKNNGEIDEKGDYIVKYEDPNKIRITLAENKALDVEYYYDKAKTHRIDGVAYLMPGDTIYIDFIESNETLYNFSRYEIYEIDKEGNREKALTLTDTDTQYTIPENIKTKEVQIIPFGENNKEAIRLSVVDENGKNVISGKWQNGETVLNNNFLTVGPSEYYQLTYSYNTKEFFFVNSSPKSTGTNGIVNFENTNSSDEDRPTEYVVKLRRYLLLTLEFDKSAEISYKGKVLEKKATDFEFKPEHKLKFGDEITVKTKSSIKVTDGDYKHIRVAREWSNSEELYIYKIKIHEKATTKQKYDGVDIIEDVKIVLPKKTSFGTVTYKVNGSEVSGACILKEGSELKIEYKITKDNYVFCNLKGLEKLFNRKTKTETIIVNTKHHNTVLDLSKLFKIEKEA